jgi:hypothetical protein
MRPDEATILSGQTKEDSMRSIIPKKTFRSRFNSHLTYFVIVALGLLLLGAAGQNKACDPDCGSVSITPKNVVATANTNVSFTVSWSGWKHSSGFKCRIRETNDDGIIFKVYGPYDVPDGTSGSKVIKILVPAIVRRHLVFPGVCSNECPGWQEGEAAKISQ